MFEVRSFYVSGDITENVTGANFMPPAPRGLSILFLYLLPEADSLLYLIPAIYAHEQTNANMICIVLNAHCPWTGFALLEIR